MAIVNIQNTNTFDEWRIKTNEIGAQLGDVSGSGITNSATTTFAGLTGINANDFVGTAATFTVSNVAGTYTVAITQAGTGYADSDTILIKGSLIGGVDGTNDATITVTGQTGGNIDTATIAGTASPGLASEFKLVQEYVDPTQTLNTTATTLADAINEHEADLGTMSLTTTGTNVTAAINELDAKQGGDALDTASSTLTGAINEHESDIGNMSLNTTANDLTAAINEIKVTADDAQTEIGGDMADDYDGADTTVISALNNLFAASSVSTLNAEYLRRDGVGDLTGLVTLDDLGISSGSDNMLIKTGASDVTRITVSAANGNVGVGKAPGTYKFDVQGSANATTLRYSGEDTDTRYLRAGGGAGGVTAITVGLDLQGANEISGDLTIGSELVFDADGYTFSEWSQDLVGAMFTGNAESGGISAVYNDETGKITLAIANNAHSHTTGNITGLQEFIEDTAGAMFSGNTESGISVTYQDGDGTVDFNVNDPTITLTGGTTGSATMTNLGNVSIATTLSSEAVQDIVGAMVTSNTETGLSVTYQDDDGTLDFALTADPVITLSGDVTGSATMSNLGNVTITTTVADDSHNHTVSNIDNFTENVQDIVGGMVNPTNTESGINVTYDDTTGKLNFDVNDPTITLTGDVTGTATMSNLGSISIATSVVAAPALNVYNVSGTRVFP
jgi:hypothetical protein